MKQYTQEEIESLQRALNGERVKGYIPSVDDLKDIQNLVAQGVLKTDVIDCGHWYSSNPELQQIHKMTM